MWIQWDFINAGTHSVVLSQYISLQAKWLVLSGIHYQSLWRYGVDSELQIDMLDILIRRYVVTNCYGFVPKPGNRWSVTVPVWLSTKQYFSLAASFMYCPRDIWYVDAIELRNHVWGARNTTKTIEVRSSSPQASSFWTVVGHTSPGDTNSGTAS